jgi:hypothetical protein
MLAAPQSCAIYIQECIIPSVKSEKIQNYQRPKKRVRTRPKLMVFLRTFKVQSLRVKAFSGRKNPAPMRPHTRPPLPRPYTKRPWNQFTHL